MRPNSIIFDWKTMRKTWIFNYCSEWAETVNISKKYQKQFLQTLLSFHDGRGIIFRIFSKYWEYHSHQLCGHLYPVSTSLKFIKTVKVIQWLELNSFSEKNASELFPVFQYFNFVSSYQNKNNLRATVMKLIRIGMLSRIANHKYQKMISINLISLPEYTLSVCSLK